MPRLPLLSPLESRDALRQKDSWASNVYGEGVRARKRAGFGSKVIGTSPGQGLFNYAAATVSIQNDVLKVGAGSFAL